MKYDKQESFEQKHKQELGVGRYTYLGVRNFVVSMGSLAAGGYAGFKFLEQPSKLLLPKLSSKEIQLYGKNMNLHQVIGLGAGAMIGSMTSGIFLGYENWKNQESARLAAREMNEDISTMKIRFRTDGDLLEENTRLRELLDAKESPQTTAFATDASHESTLNMAADKSRA